MDLKELLGEELYQQVTAKVGDKKLDVVNDGRWIPKDKFDSLNEEKKEYKKQVDDLNKELGNLQGKLKDNEEATRQIDELKQKIADKEADITKVKKTSAIEIALTQAKAKNPKAVKALLDLEKVEVTDEGIKGLEEQLKTLKESDGYLFEEETPAGTGGSLGNGQKPKGGNGEVTKEAFTKMDYHQRVDLYNKDPELYKKLNE